MSQLFVANGTLQHFHFNYRIPEVANLRILEIPAGQQKQFNEDFTDGQLVEVIKQLERYGARPANDVDAILSPRTLIYSVNRKPINVDTIDYARERDQNVRQEVSAQKTEESGLAQLAATQQRLRQSGSGAQVASTSLEVEQLEDRNDARRTKGGVDTEVVVSRNAGRKRTEKKR